MDLSTTVFSHNGNIPSTYTCDGKNISPNLSWKEIPNGTKSFVLICDDPDAPVGTWVHWVLYNIPDNISNLEENVKELPFGTQVGLNSWNKKEYGGPCPPHGTHRYFFKLYALDSVLNVDPYTTGDSLQKAMKGHILDEAILIGKYSR